VGMYVGVCMSVVGMYVGVCSVKTRKFCGWVGVASRHKYWHRQDSVRAREHLPAP